MEVITATTVMATNMVGRVHDHITFIFNITNTLTFLKLNILIYSYIHPTYSSLRNRKAPLFKN
jgi:hypothetical protein